MRHRNVRCLIFFVLAEQSGTDYNFPVAFDPAGHDTKKRIAGSRFGVSGIPTMYIIGRDGKIAAVLVGTGNDAKITAVLNAQGLKTKSN
jgi:hypothetical protein